jgi:hypothetical protein
MCKRHKITQWKNVIDHTGKYKYNNVWHIPHDKVSVVSSEDKLQFRVDYLKTKDNNRQEEQVRRFTSYDVSYMEKYPQDFNGEHERIRK